MEVPATTAPMVVELSGNLQRMAPLACFTISPDRLTVPNQKVAWHATMQVIFTGRQHTEATSIVPGDTEQFSRLHLMVPKPCFIHSQMGLITVIQAVE